MLTGLLKPVEYEEKNSKVFTAVQTRNVTPSSIEFRSNTSPNSPGSNDETPVDFSNDFSAINQKEEENVEKQILELNEGIAAL
jgi:hypothetical protein